MLEVIKDAIDAVPDIPFHRFYIQYMLSVQDINIELEMGSTFKNVTLDVSALSSVDRLIHTTYEGLVNGYDK